MNASAVCCTVIDRTSSCIWSDVMMRVMYCLSLNMLLGLMHVKLFIFWRIHILFCLILLLNWSNAAVCIGTFTVVCIMIFVVQIWLVTFSRGFWTDAYADFSQLLKNKQPDSGANDCCVDAPLSSQSISHTEIKTIANVNSPVTKDKRPVKLLTLSRIKRKKRTGNS